MNIKKLIFINLSAAVIIYGVNISAMECKIADLKKQSKHIEVQEKDLNIKLLAYIESLRKKNAKLEIEIDQYKSKLEKYEDKEAIIRKFEGIEKEYNIIEQKTRKLNFLVRKIKDIQHKKGLHLIKKEFFEFGWLEKESAESIDKLSNKIKKYQRAVGDMRVELNSIIGPCDGIKILSSNIIKLRVELGFSKIKDLELLKEKEIKQGDECAEKKLAESLKKINEKCSSRKSYY